jgi:RNA polymerase sigma factor (sigma-70 family)
MPPNARCLCDDRATTIAELEKCVELVRLRHVDRDASNRLMRRFEGLIWARIRQRISDFCDADQRELFQEICLRLWLRMKYYDGSMPFCNFVRMVVSQGIVDWFRGRPRGNTQPLTDASDIAVARTEQGLDEVELACLQQKIECWSPLWQRVWAEHTEGVSSEKIGQGLETNPRTVRHWLSQMRRELARCVRPR